MNPIISSVTPRFFPQPLTQRLSRLTQADFTSPRTELPQIQKALSPHEQTPAPAREILMATALASQGPVIARMYLEEEKRNPSLEPTDYTVAA